MPTVGTIYTMKITNNRPNTFVVSWEVTTTCNYHCWYCDDYYHNGKFKWPNLRDSLEFFDSICSRHELVHVDMAGGEPTLWPDLHSFCEQKPENLVLEITSNGSRTENWWRNNHSHFSAITISFHPKTADAEHIKRVLSIISDGKKSSHLFLIADGDYMSRCLDLYEWAESSGLPMSCNFKTLAPRVDSRDLKKKIAEFKADKRIRDITSKNRFDKNTFFIKSKPGEVYLDGNVYDYNLAEVRGENRYFGWRCSAGIKTLYIRANGDLYRASCLNNGKIGNMYFDTNLDDIRETICSRPACSCLDDLMIEKTNE